MGSPSLSHLPAIHCARQCLMHVERSPSLPLWSFHPGNQCLVVSTAGEGGGVTRSGRPCRRTAQLCCPENTGDCVAPRCLGWLWPTLNLPGWTKLTLSSVPDDPWSQEVIVVAGSVLRSFYFLSVCPKVLQEGEARLSMPKRPHVAEAPSVKTDANLPRSWIGHSAPICLQLQTLSKDHTALFASFVPGTTRKILLGWKLGGGKKRTCYFLV